MSASKATVRPSLLVAVLLYAGLTACDSGSSAGNNSVTNADPSVVQTKQGAVQGTINADGRAFLGIPFAAPPLGALRWTPPQPAAAWSGTRDATQFGNRCPQFATPIGNASGDNEDCLYLNVYTPTLTSSAKPLPVMLWLHGGSWVLGSGSDYPGDVLAATGNVIVVTTNYRLGPFGYLALDGLASEDAHGSTGDYGMFDQVAALQWVQDNIAHFGGDTKNVTLFGESAGGISTCQLMASPLATGLFHQAIIESGPCMTPMSSLKSAESYGKSFAARSALGCNSLLAADVVSCMRGKSTDEILDAETSLEQQAIAGSFGPAVDGYALPETPEAAVADGSFSTMPLINGSNHDEGKLFVALMYDLAIPPSPLDSDNYQAALITGLDEFDSSLAALTPLVAPLIVAQYPLSNYPAPAGFDPYYAPAHDAVAAVFTDALFGCGAYNFDTAVQPLGQPLYGYEFSDPNPPIPYTDPYVPPPLAGHASELVYVFQATLEGGAISPTQLDPDQLALSTQMQHYWTNFATTGNPNGNSLPQWPQYTGSAPQLLTLAPGAGASLPLTVSSFRANHDCSFWSLFGD